MSLLVTLEHAPHRQSRQEIQHESGDLTIGRSNEAGWQIEDPDMLVSRFHCVISGSEGHFQVTDSSRGGLFIDGSDRPLGAGNSVALEEGMRLRLGDYVLRVHLPQAARPVSAAAPVQTEAPSKSAGSGFTGDDFFSVRTPVPKPMPRPASLPDLFEAPRKSAFEADPRPPGRQASPAFDDPFTMDPVPSRPQPGQRPVPQPDFADPFLAAAPAPRRQPEPPAAPAPRPAEAADNAALNAAFFRGLGVDPVAFSSGNAEEQMVAMGARFRLLVEGLAHLLKNRAQEKRNARVAQTIIGHSDVNPLKFLATVDDMLAALAREKGPGYLAPDIAITAAFRDLAEHNINSWNGVQTALRAMIDRFNPQVLEEELKEKSAIETLLAGGKRAKLWQLYEERFQQIARSAEDRFLGEVGSDFRDAYEKAAGERK